MQAEVIVMRAFVDGETGGNPAGVVLNGDDYTDAQKQTIATQVGASETAFVCSSQNANVALRFFTPKRPIDHCGHATVASFALLRQRRMVTGDVATNETVDGIRSVSFRGEQVFLEQRAARFTSIAPALQERALHALGLSSRHLLAPVEVVNTGNSFLMLPVRTNAIVQGATPWFDQIEKLSEELDLIGFYLFCLKPEVEGRDAAARMFAPRFGIREEAATGMAAGPCACFMRERLKIAKNTIRIEQGRLMRPPSPSVLTVVLEDAPDTHVLVGGAARSAQTRTVQLD